MLIWGACIYEKGEDTEREKEATPSLMNVEL